MTRLRTLSRVLTLVVVAFVFCTPLFLGLRSVDQENDEAIYSYAVESILETGDWMSPRSSPDPGMIFLEKPPLKFWLVALPIRLGLLPKDDVGLRFWDAVMGGLAFLYVFSFGRRMAGWLCGVVALLTLYTFDQLLFTHGLRGNNMEAAVVLAYAGGLYHYLRWSQSERPGWSRAHAAAVGLYFFLGFMTKFVAALFLPAVIGAASLEVPAVRTRLLREWRTWLAVAAGLLVLAAPWFVYQSFQPGRSVWSTMFGQHVVTRFRSALDPAHVQPWTFYFESLIRGVVNQGTVWMIAGGALLIHWRVIRQRWMAGTLVLYWFWLPFVVISFGNSKLWHYAYPFLAPVGLAAGYAIDRLAGAVVGVIAAATDPAHARRFTPPARVAGLVATVRSAWPWVQRLLVAVGLVYLVLGAVGLFHHGRLRLPGIAVDPPDMPRGALTAMLLGLLGGRGAWMTRLAVPVALLASMPIQEYRGAIFRTSVEAHPMRTMRRCLADARSVEQEAGRPVHPMYVYLPNPTFNHTIFYYYRDFGWDHRETLGDAALLGFLDDPAQWRPVLMPSELFSAFRAGNDPPGKVRPSMQVSDLAVLVLPGPYGQCAGL